MKRRRTSESRRAARTRSRAEASLLALLAERGYERTSVRALLTRAKLGKSTFYEHYRDKDSVLASALRGLARELEAAPAGDLAFAFVEPLLAHVSEQRALALRLGTTAAGNLVLARFRAVVRAQVAEELRRAFPHAAEQRLAVASEHATGALLGVLEARLRRPAAFETVSPAAAFRELVLPGLRAWLGAAPPPT